MVKTIDRASRPFARAGFTTAVTFPDARHLRRTGRDIDLAGEKPGQMVVRRRRRPVRYALAQADSAAVTRAR